MGKKNSIAEQGELCLLFFGIPGTGQFFDSDFFLKSRTSGSLENQRTTQHWNAPTTSLFIGSNPLNIQSSRVVPN